MGRALARQIADRGGISVIGIADSSAALTCAPGTALNAAQLRDLVAGKEAGRALAECAMPEGLSVRLLTPGDVPGTNVFNGNTLVILSTNGNPE